MSCVTVGFRVAFCLSCRADELFFPSRHSDMHTATCLSGVHTRSLSLSCPHFVVVSSVLAFGHRLSGVHIRSPSCAQLTLLRSANAEMEAGLSTLRQQVVSLSARCSELSQRADAAIADKEAAEEALRRSSDKDKASDGAWCVVRERGCPLLAACCSLSLRRRRSIDAWFRRFSESVHWTCDRGCRVPPPRHFGVLLTCFFFCCCL